MRIGFLVSHPIQYFAPLFRELAKHCDLTVFYAHRQTAEQQARAGFDVAFEWDVDLLSGYHSKFLRNVARAPSTDRFFGCDTPEIAGEIAGGSFDGFIVPGWALRTYWQAIEACRRADKPVTLCGEMAGQPRAFALLYGMGLRSYSMSPAFIPSIKELTSHLTQERAAKILRKALKLKTTSQVLRYMGQQIEQLAPNLKLLDTA